MKKKEKLYLAFIPYAKELVSNHPATAKQILDELENSTEYESEDIENIVMYEVVGNPYRIKRGALVMEELKPKK